MRNLAAPLRSDDELIQPAVGLHEAILTPNLTTVYVRQTPLPKQKSNRPTPAFLLHLPA